MYVTRSFVGVLLTKYHLGGKIKKYEMEGVCGIYVERCIQGFGRET
jgi:hypothetical protein